MSSNTQPQESDERLDGILIGAMYHKMFLDEYRKHRGESWYHLPEKIVDAKAAIKTYYATEIEAAKPKQRPEEVNMIAANTPKHLSYRRLKDIWRSEGYDMGFNQGIAAYEQNMKERGLL